MGMTDDFVAAVSKYNAVRCDTCGKVKRMDDVLKARSFGHGWPECHGETMRLVKLDEVPQ